MREFIVKVVIVVTIVGGYILADSYKDNWWVWLVIVPNAILLWELITYWYAIEYGNN